MRVERGFCVFGALAILMASGGAALAAPSPPMVVSLTAGPGGDASGTGSATITIDPTASKVCYTLTTSLTDAQMAHIHKGAAGQSGPVVVPFADLSGGKTQGCATVSADVANALLANPADYYVNVHTPSYPGGAIRGQLK
jgi:hypothetical protein